MINENTVSDWVKKLLIDTLSLNIEIDEMFDELLLLGNIPEFDSMTIVSVITAIEKEYQLNIDDNDLTAEIFESVVSLIEFIQEQKSLERQN